MATSPETRYEQVARTRLHGWSAARPRLSVRVFDSYPAAAAVREAWDRLVLETGADLFATFDYGEIWWRHFGRDRALRILAFLDGDQLAAVIPCFYEELRWGWLSLRVIRLVGSDHGVTTASFAVRSERVDAVAGLLLRELDKDSEWDLVHFGELPAYFGHAAALARELKAGVGNRWVVRHNPNAYPQMIFDLASSYPEYLQSLSGSERANIRKRERRFQEEHQVQVEVVQGDAFPEQLDGFVKQHEAQWRWGGRLGHFSDWPGSLAFQRELGTTLAWQDRLLMVRVSADRRPVGYQYNYVFNGRVHWITGSRSMDPQWESYSPGRLLHCATVRAAIDAGAAVLDGLGGHYEFKRRLGARTVHLQTISISRSGWRRALRLGAFTAVTRLLDLIYHRIWYWRLAPWLLARFPGLQRGVAGRGLWTRFIRARFLVASRRPHSHPPAGINQELNQERG